MAAKSLTQEGRLSLLEPATQAKVRELRARLEAAGVPTHVGSTLRDPVQQAGIVSAGRSATKASWHLLGRAIDLYPIDPATGKPDLSGKRVELFRKMHELAAPLGFRGIAFNDDGSKRYITTSKGKVWDGGHLEYRGGLTYAQAESQFQRNRVA